MVALRREKNFKENKGMKKILVPTDFSSCAEKAFSFALEIARRSGAEIMLLHVCDLFDTRQSKNKDLLAEHNRFVTSEVQGKPEKYKVAAAAANVRLTVMIYSGQPVQTIVAIADESNADLIVLGTLGASGIKTALVGTTATKVLKKATVPVITVPYEYEWKVPERILIASNDEKTEAYLEPVFRLADLFTAKLYSITISHESEDAIQMMEHSRLVENLAEHVRKHYPQKVQHVHLTGENFYQVMEEFIGLEKIDMLVMFTHERSIIENIFNASRTKRMAYHTTIPLLSIKV